MCVYKEGSANQSPSERKGVCVQHAYANVDSAHCSHVADLAAKTHTSLTPSPSQRSGMPARVKDIWQKSRTVVVLPASQKPPT